MESSPTQSRRDARRGKDDDDDLDGMEPLVDTTEALTRRSKRSERHRKKMEKRSTKAPGSQSENGFLGLPVEIILDILYRLRPSDVYAVRSASRALRCLIDGNEANIAGEIIAARYACLAKCFRMPVPLEDVNPEFRPALEYRVIRPWQHVSLPDRDVVCVCSTCTYRWDSLCVIIDFAHWTQSLEDGRPIPRLRYGETATWNTALIRGHAAKVEHALRSPLCYARILEIHLVSTVTAIRRHSLNQGNRRTRFKMTEEHVRSGTDEFLEGHGSAEIDLPYHRDTYYMLEAYMPNRTWIRKEKKWVYVSADTHERDVRLWTRYRAMLEFGKTSDFSPNAMAMTEVALSEAVPLPKID